MSCKKGGLDVPKMVLNVHFLVIRNIFSRICFRCLFYRFHGLQERVFGQSPLPQRLSLEERFLEIVGTDGGL